MKRKFAILLATTLALNSFPAPVFAADDFDIPVAAVEEDADLSGFDFGDDFEGVAEAVEPEATETEDEVEEVDGLAEESKTYTVSSPSKIPDQKWTGSVPDLSQVDELATITVDDGLILTRGKDYTVAASTADAGVAQALFTTMGEYAEDKINSVNFNIVEDSSASTYTVDVDTSTFVYDGTALTAAEVAAASTVIRNGNTKLTTADFTVTLTTTAGNGTDAGSTFDAVFSVNSKEIAKKTISIAKFDLSKAYKLTATPSEALVYNGSAQTPTFSKIEYQLTSTSAAVAFANTDYTVGSCSNNTNAGTAKVSISATSTSTNFTGTGSAEFTISAFDLSSAIGLVVSSGGKVTYNGKAQNPEVGVKAYFEDKLNATEIPAADYKVKYVNTASKDVGTYQITIEPSSTKNLTGTATKTIDGYEITAADISTVTVTQKKDIIVGTDVVATLTDYFTVKSGDYELTAADYNVAYKTDNHNSAEKATVITLTGKGNFTKTKEITYTAIAKEMAASYKPSTAPALVYDGTAKRIGADVLGALIATDTSGKTLTAADYTVTSWSNNINATTATSKATATIKGKGDYEGRSATVEFAISPANMADYTKATVTGIASGSYFTGAAITGAAVVLTKGTENTTLTSDDFTLTAKTIEGGYLTAVTVTGKGNYTGTIDSAVKVESDVADLGSAVITGDIPAGLTAYNEASIKNYIKVTVNGTELKNYSVSDIVVPSNIKIGSEVTFKITAADLTGSKNGSAKVVARNIADVKKIEVTGTYTYTGEALTPTANVVITKPDDAAALTTDDYTISFSNNTNAGKATVTVTGKGNYTGTATGTFTIGKYNLTAVTLAEANYPDGAKRQFKEGKPDDLSSDLKLSVEGAKRVFGTDDYTATLTTTNIKKTAGGKAEDCKVEYAIKIKSDSKNYTATYPAGKDAFTVSYPLVVRTVDTADVTMQNNAFKVNDPLTVAALGTVTVAVDGATLTTSDYSLALEKYNDTTKEYDAFAGGTVGSLTEKYNLVVSFKGYYAGTFRKAISLGAATFDVNEVKLIDKKASELVYDGTGKEADWGYIGSLPITAANYEDYFTITYTDAKGKEVAGLPINAGTYTATVKATANYGGSTGATATFTISPKTLSATEFKALAENIEVGEDSYFGGVYAVVYRGSSTETPKCYDSTAGYTESTDFEIVSWEKEWDTSKGNEGEAVIGLVKDGNYTYDGTYTTTFRWVQGVINNDLFTVEEVTYNGQPQKPELKPVEGTGVSADWIKECTYTADLVNAGVGNACIKYKVVVPEDSDKYIPGEYTNWYWYDIKPASIEKATIAKIADQEYTGKELRPDVVIEDENGILLVNGINYVIVYENNTEIGEATVTVTGIGNYTNSKKTSFKIVNTSNEPVKGQLTKLTPKKKTFKASDLKSKSQSFKITAEVNSGAKVSFKKTSGNKNITVSSSGKVTVKKGLKKGTYKIKVKLSAPATEDYTERIVTRTITIVVK